MFLALIRESRKKKLFCKRMKKKLRCLKAPQTQATTLHFPLPSCYSSSSLTNLLILWPVWSFRHLLCRRNPRYSPRYQLVHQLCLFDPLADSPFCLKCIFSILKKYINVTLPTVIVLLPVVVPLLLDISWNVCKVERMCLSARNGFDPVKGWCGYIWVNKISKKLECFIFILLGLRLDF